MWSLLLSPLAPAAPPAPVVTAVSLDTTESAATLRVELVREQRPLSVLLVERRHLPAEFAGEAVVRAGVTPLHTCTASDGGYVAADAVDRGLLAPDPEAAWADHDIAFSVFLPRSRRFWRNAGDVSVSCPAALRYGDQPLSLEVLLRAP